MKTFEESMASIAGTMRQTAKQSYPGSAFRLGEVLEAGPDSLRISCDGMELDNEDLWVNPALMQDYSPSSWGPSREPVNVICIAEPAPRRSARMT